MNFEKLSKGVFFGVLVTILLLLIILLIIASARPEPSTLNIKLVMPAVQTMRNGLTSVGVAVRYRVTSLKPDTYPSESSVKAKIKTAMQSSLLPNNAPWELVLKGIGDEIYAMSGIDAASIRIEITDSNSKTYTKGFIDPIH